MTVPYPDAQVVSNIQSPSLYEIDGDKLTLKPHPGQAAVLRSQARFILMLAGTQGGKALKADTPVPTPNGFIEIRNLRRGDMVYGEDGLAYPVTFVSETWFDHKCYEVVFDDGGTIICDAEHQWTVKSHRIRKNETRAIESSERHSRPQSTPRVRGRITLTTEAMSSRVGEAYSIDLPTPIQYPFRALPIPPYTLGAWLGDGSSGSSTITCSDIDVAIIERIQAEWGGVIRHEHKGRTTSYSLSKGKGTNSRFARHAQTIGVWKNKHIPDLYRLSSIEQRWELLRGLMDTDGYCDKDGGMEFCSTNQRLANDVLELVRSLGIKARLRTGNASIGGRVVGKKYRVVFYADGQFFWLPRKQARVRKPVKPNTSRLYIRDVRPVSSVPVLCISVDSPNHLYLASRSYVPTHNTSFGPWWLWSEIQRMGAGDYIAATSTYDLFKLKMLPEIRKVYEEILQIGRYWPGVRVIELCDENGKFWARRQDDAMYSRIILRSAEAPSGLESSTAKAAWLDEVGMDNWDVTTWEAVQRRLSIARGRALGTTTVYNLGWTKREWYDRWASGDKDYDVVQFDSVVNPTFPRDEYERAQRTLPEWRFDMYYRGRFAKPEGLIYKDFNEGTMLFDYAPRELWGGLPHYIGIDFGGANNASLYAVEDTSVQPSVLYIYAEYLEGGLSTKEHAANMKARKGRVKDWQITGGSSSETQERRDWKEEGIQIYEPAYKDVEVGISNVIELIKTNRLRVARHLSGLLSELNSYRRRLLPDGDTSEEIENKSLFHRLDALRYMCLRVTKKGKKKAGAWR